MLSNHNWIAKDRGEESGNTLVSPNMLQTLASSLSHRVNSWRNCSVKMMTQVLFTGFDELARSTLHVPRKKERNILLTANERDSSRMMLMSLPNDNVL